MPDDIAYLERLALLDVPADQIAVSLAALMPTIREAELRAEIYEDLRLSRPLSAQWNGAVRNIEIIAALGRLGMESIVSRDRP